MIFKSRNRSSKQSRMKWRAVALAKSRASVSCKRTYTLEHDSFIAKGLEASDAVESRFYKAADDIIERDELDNRCLALQKARLENPKLFKALQSL
jgi:hypothetical protein